ncbi:MAG: N-acetylmuramoyl-L-alanine amidase [Myxococcota bacterium]
MTARMLPRLLLVGVAGLLLGAERPSDVRGVQHWSYPDFTRVVIELTQPVRTEVERLPADAAAGRPERLYLDLPRIWVGHHLDAPIPVGDGLLRGVRVGQFKSDTARVVIDLQRYDRHRVRTLTNPHRLLVDVYGSRGRPSAPSVPPVSSAPPSQAPTERLPAQLRGVRTVVIDAGHGGVDPGALGPRGLREKDVTLAVALDLEKRLGARGFRVVMTRRRDTTVSLEERTARAEGAGGDVFLSIHVNAARRRSAHGIETYYLDRTHERHTLRVAARENGVPAGALDPLQRAVAGLRVSEVGSQSAKLAQAVHGELIHGVRKAFGTVTNLGVKQGPFHVLFLSDSPSVLVEVGFLTHREESRRLRTRWYRSVVAEHLARGLSAYRSESAALLTARAR